MKSSSLALFVAFFLARIVAPQLAPGMMAETDGSGGVRSKGPQPKVTADYGSLPLSFAANDGQADARVKFVSRGSGYSLSLTDSSAILSLGERSDVVRMELVGASRDSRVTGVEGLPGKVNYFVGKDPANWRSNVATFAKVKYAGVYPGIDLVYYGNQHQLEYDFLVAPGGKAEMARLHFAGAKKVMLGKDGDLRVIATKGEVGFRKPVIYQQVDGRRVPVEGRFTLMAKNTIGFKVGEYDHSRELVIDPVLAYATYLGGLAQDVLNAVAVDSAGDAYVTGSTTSKDFPITGPTAFQANPPVPNTYGYPISVVFVTKINRDGTAILYSTYLGGNDLNSTGATATSIAVDGAGDAYVTGQTSQTDFPVTASAFQPQLGSASVHAFVSKLNTDGSKLIYSTYLGGTRGVYGNSMDAANGIAVDASGDAYVVGSTLSGDFPTTPGAFQTVNKAYAAYSDRPVSFITKFNPPGTTLLYSTFLGGSGGESNVFGDVAYAVAVSAAGNVYVTGTAGSPDFPITSNAFQKTTKSAPVPSTAFVAELNSAGSGLVYSTFLGGSGNPDPYGKFGGPFDVGNAIAIDANGHAFVTGNTYSPDFPLTENAFQKSNHGAEQTFTNGSNPIYYPNAFLTELNEAGSGLVYSTYFGGLSTYATGVAVDAAGVVHMAGRTSPIGFPATTNAYATTGLSYEAEFSAGDSAPIYAGMFGSSGPDEVTGLALDSLANCYVVGYTSAHDKSATPGAFQTVNRSNPLDQFNTNGFITKLARHAATTSTVTADHNPSTTGEMVTFTAHVAPTVGGHPTGSVGFLIDGDVVESTALDESGDATYRTSSLPAGSHLVTAGYLGDPGAFSSSIGTLAETVTGGVTSAPYFSILTGDYASGTPIALFSQTDGAVFYYTLNGATPTTSSTKYTGPISLIATSTLKAIATSTGNSTSSVTSATYTVVPNADIAYVNLTSSVNPAVVGEAITFKATVFIDTGGPVPTGIVTFRHGNVIMGSAPLVNGMATFTISSLTAQGYAINADYGGDAYTSGTGSSSLLLYVNP